MTSEPAARRVVVVGRRDVASGVVELELAPAGAGVRTVPAWSPGAHIDVVLDEETVRQYSLCGGTPRSLRIAVLREQDGRGGSRRIYDEVEVGQELDIRGPRNHFALQPADQYLFIAGGIGVTPIIPMIEEAEARGARWSLLYGGRSRSTMAYLDELRQWGDRVTVAPMDEVGLLDLGSALSAQQPGTLVYCCGPESLLEAVERRCVLSTAVDLHVERFSPKPLDPDVTDEPFTVHLSESGTTVEVPVGRTLVDVLSEAGVAIMTSCEEGTCGTCETEVLEGVPDHRDSVLSDEEQAEGNCMMVCVSRALTSSLTLRL